MHAVQARVSGSDVRRSRTSNLLSQNLLRLYRSVSGFQSGLFVQAKNLEIRGPAGASDQGSEVRTARQDVGYRVRFRLVHLSDERPRLGCDGSRTERRRRQFWKERTGIEYLSRITA